MTDKELRKTRAQELAKTMETLSERNMGVITNIINTMAIVERAVRELPEDYQMREATA